MKITAVRNLAYGVQVDLQVWECPDCGIVYGVPVSFANACRETGATYHCPNGHSLGWSETAADRERKRAQAAERRANSAEEAARYQREKAETLRRSAAAYKGQLTRMRNRIANGVCPVPGCKRSGFDKTLQHIAAKHPGWYAEHRGEVVGNEQKEHNG